MVQQLKNTGCSYTGPGFSGQHPQCGLLPFVTPVPGDPTLNLWLLKPPKQTKDYLQAKHLYVIQGQPGLHSETQAQKQLLRKYKY